MNCWFMLGIDHTCEGGGVGREILESKHLDYVHSMGREVKGGRRRGLTISFSEGGKRLF